jgi:hypothetical protein
LQQEIITLIDDVDGSPADETVNFALEGAAYELDLSDENARRFRAAFHPWMKAARRAVQHRRYHIPEGTEPTVWVNPQKVRAWAKSQGIPCNHQGYPRREIQRAFIAAWLDGKVDRAFL